MKGRMFDVGTRLDYVEVPEVEAYPLFIGLYESKGLAMFENGEIAICKNSGHFNTVEGVRGFIVNTFEDGSTQWIKFQRPPGTPGEGGEVKFDIIEGTFEYIGGTGRFEGIKGKGSFTGKYFPTYDVAYWDMTAEYTLP